MKNINFTSPNIFLCSSVRAPSPSIFSEVIALLNETVLPSHFAICSVAPRTVRGLATRVPASIAGIFQFRVVVWCSEVSVRTLGSPGLTRVT